MRAVEGNREREGSSKGSGHGAEGREVEGDRRRGGGEGAKAANMQNK